MPGVVRRHAGPVRGDHRRPRPAAPARQGHGLGDGRVLDAAARHGRAQRPRVGQGPHRRADPRDPAAHRALAARRRRPRRASASGRSPSTATCSRPTAGRARRRSPAATSRSASALITFGMERHLTGQVAAVSVGIVNGLDFLDLDYSEDSQGRGRLQRRRHGRRHVRRAAGHGRGQAVRPGRRERDARPRGRGAGAACSTAQAEVLATVRR